ncbi:MAG: UbiA family prenyltransferase, partial [Planctomycetota bacterium]
GALSPVVLGVLLGYSYVKRFSALVHIVLGVALGLAPLGAWIAVRGTLEGDLTPPLLLFSVVWTWVAGFDVIYALQDLDFDRQAGLRSIPAALGWRGSAWVSRALHLASMASLVMAWHSEPRFGAVFGAAVVVVGFVLIAEHVVLAVRREKGLEMAFFTLNGVIACLLGAAGILDVLT